MGDTICLLSGVCPPHVRVRFGSRDRKASGSYSKMSIGRRDAYYEQCYLSCFLTLSCCAAPIYVEVVQSFVLIMALQPLVGPWLVFQFLDLYIVGLLGRGISPSQGRYLLLHCCGFSTFFPCLMQEEGLVGGAGVAQSV
jgi:hypothetical protein